MRQKQSGESEPGGVTRVMTLDDVRAIAQQAGPDLTYSDLRDFFGTDVGSGLFIMNYDIEGGDYHLMVGSASTDMNTPVWYAYLGRTGNAPDVNKDIDIRYYDVDKYLADGIHELVRPLPEGNTQPTPQPAHEPWMSSWSPLSSLPADLSMEQAIGNGMAVVGY